MKKAGHMTKRRRNALLDSAAPMSSCLSQEGLASFGRGRFGYIRTLTLAKAKKIFPEMAKPPKDATLLGLFSADGMPIFLTDDKAIAIAVAWNEALELATVH